MSLKVQRPQTIILKWDEKEQLWHRLRSLKPFTTRKNANNWIKQNRENGCFLAIPNNQDILKCLEQGEQGANSFINYLDAIDGR